MRRIFLSLVAFGLAAAVASDGIAQQNRRGAPQGADQQDRETQRARRKLEREMQAQELPLPELENTGPCPYVKVLYDAARTIEFTGGRQASSAVAYSGEIQGLTATCRYKEDQPIVVDINVTFTFGKGPMATENQKTYTYFVAVTDRNRSVLAKEEFTTTADFGRADRLLGFQRVANITIPRANERVSGENFEILVGFKVTPEMAAFNRNGTRFVVNATGQQANAQQGASPGP